MGILKLPPKIIEQFDKIRRHGLWTKKLRMVRKVTLLRLGIWCVGPRKMVASEFSISRFKMTQCF